MSLRGCLALSVPAACARRWLWGRIRRRRPAPRGWWPPPVPPCRLCLSAQPRTELHCVHRQRRGAWRQCPRSTWRRSRRQRCSRHRRCAPSRLPCSQRAPRLRRGRAALWRGVTTMEPLRLRRPRSSARGSVASAAVLSHLGTWRPSASNQQVQASRSAAASMLGRRGDLSRSDRQTESTPAAKRAAARSTRRVRPLRVAPLVPALRLRRRQRCCVRRLSSVMMARFRHAPCCRFLTPRSLRSGARFCRTGWPLAPSWARLARLARGKQKSFAWLWAPRRRSASCCQSLEGRRLRR